MWLFQRDDSDVCWQFGDSLLWYFNAGTLAKIEATVNNYGDQRLSFSVNNLVKPYSAKIDFRRQNLTSVDVRFWRLKSIPAL